jgi:chromate transporter
MEDRSNPQPPETASFKDALKFWTRLGFISFGGPAGQIAIMHQEVVERRRWVGENQFLRALNFCMLLPGPEAQQLATYIGWRMNGIVGGIAAGALFVIPSDFRDAAAQLPGRGAHRHPCRGRRLLRHPAGGGGRGGGGGAAHRQKGAQHGVLYAFAAVAFMAIFFFKVPFPISWRRRRWVDCSWNNGFPGCSARARLTSRPGNAVSRMRTTTCKKTLPPPSPM